MGSLLLSSGWGIQEKPVFIYASESVFGYLFRREKWHNIFFKELNSADNFKVVREGDPFLRGRECQEVTFSKCNKPVHSHSRSVRLSAASAAPKKLTM